MPAILRQQFTDPSTGELRAREINLDVEVVRADDAYDMSSTIQLRAEPVPTHNQNIPDFAPVAICPTEALAALLDGNRTTNPPRCQRTRLSQKPQGLTFFVDNIGALDIDIGHPVVVVDSFELGNTKIYGIVKEINGHAITLYDNGQHCQFYKGALIQNLANRWVSGSKIDGVKAQLKRPLAPTFRAKRTTQGIEFLFVVPLNTGVAKYYDVYIRNHSFGNRIGDHWVPDAVDVPIEVDRKTITTYNGGPEAGGGTITDTTLSKLTCVAITKTGVGLTNVYESICSPQTVQ